MILVLRTSRGVFKRGGIRTAPCPSGEVRRAVLYVFQVPHDQDLVVLSSPLKRGRRPIQGVLAFLNCYVWRWAWFRISWSVPNTPEELERWGEDHAIPGTFKLHFPVRPNWLFKKRF